MGLHKIQISKERGLSATSILIYARPGCHLEPLLSVVII